MYTYTILNRYTCFFKIFIFVEGDKSKYRSVFKYLKFIFCNPYNSNSQTSPKEPQFTNQTDNLFQITIC